MPEELRLGLTCEIQIGKTPSRNVSAYWAEGRRGHTWLTIGDLRERVVTRSEERISELGRKAVRARVVPRGTVLMSFKLTLGKTAVTGIDLFTNEAIAAFYPKSPNLMPSWLVHALPTIASRGHADQAIKGATLNKAKLNALPVVLPEPEEQLRVAAILDASALAVDECVGVVSKLEAVRAGLLDSLSHGLAERNELGQAKADELPPGWTISTLEGLAAAPICYGVVQPGFDTFDGVPVLAIKDLHGDYRSDLHRARPSIEAAYSRSRVEGGDVLVSLTGTIGRIGVVPGHFRGNINRHLARIRGNPGVLPNFLRYALEAPATQRRLLSIAEGTTRAEIPIWVLKQFPIPVPRLSEQERIAEALTTFDGRLRAERQVVAKRRKLHAGLVQDLIGTVQREQLPGLAEVAAA